MKSLRVVISATFTAEPLEAVLRFWAAQLNAEFHIEFAPYNQLAQTLLAPEGVFARNENGINVLLARLQDLGHLGVEQNVRQLLSVLRGASRQFPSPFIFCLCPSAPDAVRSHLADRLARLIESSLEDVPSVHFLRHRRIEQLYPVPKIFDEAAERLAEIPYTESYFAALGTMLVRETAALLSPPYKVIALDCDNTLWQGICGEDGPRGVRLDPDRRALQQFLIEQRDAGMLLTLASKNNEEDVLETFRANPDMPLRLDHIAARRLNWEPKADNLAALAGDLDLSLDSFIFIDDSPKECAEVRERAPEILTLALPEDLSRIPHFLRHVWAFDHPVVTEEDRKRSVYYQQAQEFGREIEKAESLEHFMATLGLEVRVSTFVPDQASRVAQLTQRTNQFNFTSVRRSEAEILALARRPGYELFTVNVSDRFGSYGLVGVMIVVAEARELRVDTLLLSCRALGRGVEHRMLRFIGEVAAERNLNSVAIELRVTIKNRPAVQFLESIGANSINGDHEEVFSFPSAALGQLEWKPPAASTADNGKSPTRRPKIRTHRLIDFARIADSFSTPEEILSAMRASRCPAAHHAAMTDVERELASIWTDLLHCPSVQLTDKFFDLGGHSLLAVLLLVRVREEFGVELSIDDVYSGTLTLGELASKIESLQFAQIAPGDYEAVLAEIENLSDEDVRRMLAEENTGGGA